MSPITRRRAKQTKRAPSRLTVKQEKRLQRRAVKSPSPSEESQEEESHESEIEESDSDNEFEVETILDKKIKNGEVFYRIKWRGFDMRYATWEPVENIQNAPGKLEAFEKTRKLEEARAREEKKIEANKEKRASLLGKRDLPKTRSNRRLRYEEEMQEEEESESEEEEKVEKRVLRNRNQAVKAKKSGGREDKVKGKGRSGGKAVMTRKNRRSNYEEESESQESEDEEEEEEQEEEEEDEEEEGEEEEQEQEEEEEEEEKEENESSQIESPGKIKSVEREKMQEEAPHENTSAKVVTKEIPQKHNILAPIPIVTIPETTVAQSEPEKDAKKGQKGVKPVAGEALQQEKTLAVEQEKPSLAKSPTSAAFKSTLYPQENSAFQSCKLVASKDGLIPATQHMKPVITGPTDLPKPQVQEKHSQPPHHVTSPHINPLLIANSMNYLANQPSTDDMALKNFITFQGSLQISNYLFPPRDYGALNANRLPNFLAPGLAQSPNLLLANNPALLNSLALQGGLPGAALFPGAFQNNFNLPLGNYPINPLAGLSAMGNLGFPMTSVDLLGKLQGAQNPLGLEGAQLDQILGMNMNHRLNLMNLQQNIQSVDKKGSNNNEGKKDILSQISLLKQTSGANDVKKNSLTTPSQSDNKDKKADGVSNQGSKAGSSAGGNEGAAKP